MTRALTLAPQVPTAAQLLIPACMTALIFGALPLANMLHQSTPEYVLHDLTLAPPPPPPPAAPPEPRPPAQKLTAPPPALAPQRLPIPLQASLSLSRDSHSAVGDFALGFKVLETGLYHGGEDFIFEIADVDRTPVALAQQDPLYPPSARLRGIEGHVTLEFRVTPGGSVQQASVISASPASLFNRAALQAVRRWRFQPAMHQGRKVTVRVRQTLRFQLER